ncbi:MAG TPA: phospholipid scramblase-related protein [Mycobacteriales bacterium]|nr:phospholipid scramblase-related protein [Mycobacteriales bacterium]
MAATLLDAPAVVVSQVAKLSSPREEYELFAPDGTALGRIEEQASLGSFFARKLSTLTFVVSDASGATVATIEKPGAIGRSTFIVADAGGQQIGVVEQQNMFMDPQFALRTPSGEFRLTSAAINAWSWTLVDANGAQVGQISREFAGLADVFTSAEHFVVELGPALAGPTRLVSLVACTCLDFVRDERAERRRH